ncbi:hypothetical protein D3C76_1720670 [compost metagenome]
MPLAMESSVRDEPLYQRARAVASLAIPSGIRIITFLIGDADVVEVVSSTAHAALLPPSVAVTIVVTASIILAARTLNRFNVNASS